MSYRPISLSESVVPELDKQLLHNDFYIKYNKTNKKLQIVSSNTSLVNLAENDFKFSIVNTNNLENFNILNAPNTQNTPKKRNLKKIIMKKSLLFLTHLLLISFFEIIFFNYFIASYEDQALTTLVNSITQNLYNGCNNLNPQEKEVIDYILTDLIDINLLYNASLIASTQRNIYNNKLFSLSWYYFIAIFSVNLVFFIINYFYKKIKLHKILFDNLIMIIILGLYEFLFFSTIVLRYENMSTSEIEYNFFSKINNCYQN